MRRAATSSIERIAAFAFAIVASASASAQPITPAPEAPPPNRLRVEVGKTVERSVGILRSYFCDDPTLISADVVTRGDVNVWVVTGVKLGATHCRVGDALHPALLFDVTVVAKE